MPASASEYDKVAGLATTEKKNVAQPCLTFEKREKQCCANDLPPFALVATAPHVPVSHDGVGTERNLRKPAVLPSNIHLENLSRKTVKKCCRDNQFRGRPRMNPSALALARDSSKFAHSTWSAPSYGEETSTQQSRGRHSHAPWVSITVFPRGWAHEPCVLMCLSSV